MAQSARPLTSRPEDPTGEIDPVRQWVEHLRTAIGWDVLEVRTRARETFDLRRQVARHPLVATAIVLGGLYLAARIVRPLLRVVTVPGVRRSRRRHDRKSRAVTQIPERGTPTRKAHLKEGNG